MSVEDDQSGAAPANAPRRAFLGATLATGFALAVRPVAASTITTDTEGLTAGAITIAVDGGDMPAYRARPATGKGPLPVVIVVQEVFGVHEHIQDVCRRLAKLGYLAIAPELYFRQGDPRKYPEVADLLKNIVSQVPDEQVMSDLDITVNYAVANGGDPSRLALTGFCWGGRIAWLYAAHNPRMKAIAVWYGQVLQPSTANAPKSPLDLVAQMKVPVIAFYGGKDQGITQENVGKMRAAMDAAGKPFELHVYPEAGHGFNADYRPSYNPQAATDAWQRMLGWFHKYGV
ncbi:dienelactone hydrolase family protein [Silvimonas iriomotensis]|uniref:Carboxymethylenebutenolidase n=1 Tax=Silvimonas iriomotensis TaxID=449662 RepID=A0ABQ2PFF2_9NEIS|nr:dienelactone hydrolase family protein [Silvimonas iriomotensis]GGP24101.1 carboxymethylenebutenolidase [Silvimonas iriomotensis]